MSFPKINPIQTKAWSKLQLHYKRLSEVHLCQLFQEDASRASGLSFKLNDFFIDFSKQRWTPETINLFVELANELELKKAIQLYFSENELNFTEQRAVLHTALRSNKKELFLKGENIITKIDKVKEKIKTFSNSVISGEYKGATNKKITDVVNIGIGGSDLGPKLVCNTLQQYRNHLKIHFVSNIDEDCLFDLLQILNPETTLFIVVSKSFTTSETLQNATIIKDWLTKKLSKKAVKQHFIAVSANIDKAVEFGVTKENIFPMWDWVGGRFSLWSAVGLSIALALGYRNFENLLAGAQEADTHFYTSDLKENIPVLMAFLTIWYVNFFEADQEAVIPYSQYLEDLIPYFQQSFMESNGKNVDRNGEKVKYYTCPTLFGGVGCNAQHAFMQLFHQGKHLVPTDFIGFCSSGKGSKENHDVFMSNMFAQAEALAFGTYGEQIDNPFKVFEGNQPSTTILINQLNPKSLGKLLALYEHKVFVQGILWNINSFDQFGVELGKELSRKISRQLSLGDIEEKSPLMKFYKLTN